MPKASGMTDLADALAKRGDARPTALEDFCNSLSDVIDEAARKHVRRATVIATLREVAEALEGEDTWD